jgi:frataxin-like iron-binding protein CyaY
MNLRPIKQNMTELDFGNGHLILFSYQTPVAECFVSPEGRRYRMTSKKWSVTTSRHISSWLPMESAELLSQTYFDDLLSGVLMAERGGF